MAGGRIGYQAPLTNFGRIMVGGYALGLAALAGGGTYMETQRFNRDPVGFTREQIKKAFSECESIRRDAELAHLPSVSCTSQQQSTISWGTCRSFSADELNRIGGYAAWLRNVHVTNARDLVSRIVSMHFEPPVENVELEALDRRLQTYDHAVVACRNTLKH